MNDLNLWIYATAASLLLNAYFAFKWIRAESRSTTLKFINQDSNKLIDFYKAQLEKMTARNDAALNALRGE